MTKVELPVDYYLTNFKKMIDFVYQRYCTILDQRQTDFYHQFYLLSSDAQMLLVRFFMRKGDSFRLDNLKYNEIKDYHLAGTELVNHQFADWTNLAENDEWISLFNKSELIALFKQNRWKKLSRAQINTEIEALFIANQLQISDFSEASEYLLSIKIIQMDKTAFDTYRLLFFGNLHQDLTDFVLQDLGVLQYESYSISDESLPFESQQHIHAHRQCYELSEQITTTEDWSSELVIALVKAVPRGFDHDPHLNRRRGRIILSLAKQFERFAEYQKALNTYRMTSAIPSKERQIRCLDKLDKPQMAYDELLSLLNSSSEEERQFAAFFLSKVAKKLGKTMGKKEIYQPIENVVVLEKNATSVEVDSVAYLNQSGSAYWLENSLFNTLFALIYWDVIFADSPGAFFNPFQMLPSDIYLPEFKARRQKTIDALHSKIKDDRELIEHIKTSWRNHYGKACRFAHWGVIDNESIDRAIETIPAEHIRKVCLRILNDPKENRSGMPDLLFFPESGGYQLIEIKGPGDRLQKNQLRWFSFYQQHDIPHRLMRVEWSDQQNELRYGRK